MFDVVYECVNIKTHKWYKVYRFQVLTRALLQLREYHAQKQYEKMMKKYY